MIEISISCGLADHPATNFNEENPSMKPVTMGFVATVLAASTVSGGAMAQATYADDMACRQYADAQIAPMRDQVNSQGVGNALLGAGLGAALGAAVGGGRGAGIGAASGAIVGTGVGAANAQDASAYLQQQYNAYYAQCMAARTAPPPRYAQPGYPAPGAPSASQLNQQQLDQGSPPPGYYYPPGR